MYWYVYFFCARYMLIFQDDSNKKYLWSIPLSPSNILNETHPSVDPVQVYPPTPADSRERVREEGTTDPSCARRKPASWQPAVQEGKQLECLKLVFESLKLLSRHDGKNKASCKNKQASC